MKKHYPSPLNYDFCSFGLLCTKPSLFSWGESEQTLLLAPPRCCESGGLAAAVNYFLFTPMSLDAERRPFQRIVVAVWAFIHMLWECLSGFCSKQQVCKARMNTCTRLYLCFPVLLLEGSTRAGEERSSALRQSHAETPNGVSAEVVSE